MNWVKGLRCLVNNCNKSTGEASKFGGSWRPPSLNKRQTGVSDGGETVTLFHFSHARQFTDGVQRDDGPCLDRDFFVKLWVADRKLKTRKERKRRKYVVENEIQPNLEFGRFGKWFSGASSVASEASYDQAKPVLQQPPLSQSVSGFLEPGSPEEAQVAPLLARSNLLITRDIEWANLALGFEQESRYAIVDVCYPQSPVGFIREQSNVLARQVLRLRRPFLAYISDALGNELFRVRRPFWWVTSSIYAEINGSWCGTQTMASLEEGV